MSKTTNKARTQKTVRLVELALLTAIIAVMTFTPIGYLKFGPLELTLIMVPVIIGAVTLGPAAGAFLGLVFGVSSFIQCFSLSAFGAIRLSISVIKTLIVCVVPRVLAGWLTGLIFNAVTKKTKKDGANYLVASICGSAFNTIFFLGFLALLFMNTTFTPEQSNALGGATNILTTVIGIAAGINAPIELVVCAVLGSAIGKGLSVGLKKI